MSKPKMDGDGTRELMPQETDPKKGVRKKADKALAKQSAEAPSLDDLPVAKDDPAASK